MSSRYYGFESNGSGFRVYAPSIPSYELVIDDERYLKNPLQYEKGKGYFQPVGITSPDDPWFNGRPTGEDKSPMSVLDMRYDELVSSIGGLSCDQIQAGSGYPAINSEDYMGISSYNVITFYYKAIPGGSGLLSVAGSPSASVSSPQAVPVAAGSMAAYPAGEMPLRNWGLGLTLGYDAPVDDADHTQYWTVSFDFSENYGKWPYSDKAVMAVKFLFSDGGNIGDNYSVASAGHMYASDYFKVPIFEVNGRPYVEPVVCTPDLWPVTDDGSILAYPVMAEAVLYTSLYNEDGDNDQT